MAAREDGERDQPRQQLRHDAIFLQPGVAGMQGGQFDGNARAVLNAAPGAGGTDGLDRMLVVAIVPGRVVGCDRRFAQHVIRIAEALCLQPAGGVQRFLDRAAGHELLAHHAHRHVNAAADERLATPGNKAREGGRQPLGARRSQSAGHDQAPGGGVHKQGWRVAKVLAPIATADLVANERVPRGRVRDAQQRLGQAHQRHAFLAAEIVLAHEAVDRAALALGAYGLHERNGGGPGLGLGGGGKRGRWDQSRHAIRLRQPVIAGDGVAQWRGVIDQSIGHRAGSWLGSVIAR